MTKVIRKIDTREATFEDKLKALLRREQFRDPEIFEEVASIIENVRLTGDRAVLEYTNLFDERSLRNCSQLEFRDFNNCLSRVDKKVIAALQSAADRIRIYHERQVLSSWEYEEKDGTKLGQLVNPLSRVGIYVPGGKAAYPSSVLMNAIPARVAGVDEIIMVVPAPRDQLNDVVLAAAAIAGVSKVFTIGGAQAIAALAYGTETIPSVDKIVGPGNVYVAAAKTLVFGTVGIDMVAGPSEILIICDGKTDPDWVVMDLFSQAEHDERAQAILISDDTDFLDEILSSIDRLLPKMTRAAVIKKSLKENGALVAVENLVEAVELSNRIAPEHLELSVEEPHSLLPMIKNAGAVFLGRYSPEAIGDYCAGPNHVLPTSGTAKYSSPLGVYDFLKRTSVIECSILGASNLGKIAQTLAECEGLTAHARSAEYRISK